MWQPPSSVSMATEIHHIAWWRGGAALYDSLCMALSSACHAACKAGQVRLFGSTMHPLHCTAHEGNGLLRNAAMPQPCMLQACESRQADDSVALQGTRRPYPAMSPSTCSCRTPTSSATTAGTALLRTPWQCSTVQTAALTCPAKAGTGSRPGPPGSRPGPCPPAATAGLTSPPQHRCIALFLPRPVSVCMPREEKAS